MTLAFADSSALVKLYADEDGAQIVREVEVLVVSQLARVEVPSALWKKHRIGELSSSTVAVLVSEFEADYFGTEDAPSRFVVVAPTDAVLERAARLVAVHGLRAYDAVQLSSAMVSREAAGPDSQVDFLAFDEALCAAASAEGLELSADPSRP